LEGVELPLTDYNNHQNYRKKSHQGGKILQHYHFMNVTEAFKKTQTTFKALDIVINNAGILADGQWEREIEINVVSIQH
jgi:NAD(P)-dependent dehydrogenase (short-subunit alcohol dehydrogenase family)